MLRSRSACAWRWTNQLGLEQYEPRCLLSAGGEAWGSRPNLAEPANAVLVVADVSASEAGAASVSLPVAGMRFSLPARPSAYVADLVYAGSTSSANEGQPVAPLPGDRSGLARTNAVPIRIAHAVPINGRSDLLVQCPGLGQRLCLATGSGDATPPRNSLSVDFRFYRPLPGDDRLGRAGRFVAVHVSPMPRPLVP